MTALLKSKVLRSLGRAGPAPPAVTPCACGDAIFVCTGTVGGEVVVDGRSDCGSHALGLGAVRLRDDVALRLAGKMILVVVVWKLDCCCDAAAIGAINAACCAIGKEPFGQLHRQLLQIPLPAESVSAGIAADMPATRAAPPLPFIGEVTSEEKLALLATWGSALVVLRLPACPALAGRVSPFFEPVPSDTKALFGGPATGITALFGGGAAVGGYWNVSAAVIEQAAKHTRACSVLPPCTFGAMASASLKIRLRGLSLSAENPYMSEGDDSLSV